MEETRKKQLAKGSTVDTSFLPVGETERGRGTSRVRTIEDEVVA